MKSKRQRLILEIIQAKPIETQEELVRELERRGMPATQATVSRDIKELGLIKTPTGDGRYCYALPDAAPGGRERLRRLFRESLLDIDTSENLVVVKTLRGTAAAAGEAIDQLGWPEIVGTVAGDNTVLVVVRSREVAPLVADRFRELAR
ncbi:MAG TPA: arginine repressor [Thermaerobacter sp.]